MKWYIRIYGSNPNNPNSYVLVGSTPPECPGTCKICAVLASDDDFGHPVIDDDLQQQMITALSTCADQPRVLLRSMS